MCFQLRTGAWHPGIRLEPVVSALGIAGTAWCYRSSLSLRSGVMGSVAQLVKLGQQEQSTRFKSLRSKPGEADHVLESKVIVTSA